MLIYLASSLIKLRISLWSQHWIEQKIAPWTDNADILWFSQSDQESTTSVGEVIIMKAFVATEVNILSTYVNLFPPLPTSSKEKKKKKKFNGKLISQGFLLVCKHKILNVHTKTNYSVHSLIWIVNEGLQLCHNTLWTKVTELRGWEDSEDLV